MDHKYFNFLISVDLLLPMGDMVWGRLLAEFIRKNRECCYIVAQKMDFQMENRMERAGLGQRVFHLNVVLDRMIQPFAAVGNGDEHVQMIEKSDVGIGYGGVGEIAPSVLACADYVIYDEKVLIGLLNRLSSMAPTHSFPLYYV